ncbi:TonB-dependent receptor domain-containing protein [Helicobacter bizzozeronii]|uniref:TonB-dependent receptor domain-containing protein n=1 Tax=Helicobacter bizzozeronii TaxID=56877 RepID=UPI000CF1252F|nr:TonB-dependent receptor [Helicobacter bizzozeronii]
MRFSNKIFGVFFIKNRPKTNINPCLFSHAFCILSAVGANALLAEESHTLGKVTTLGERTFEYNNKMYIERKELQQRQSNQVNDLFRTRADINVAGGGLMAQKIYVRGMESRLLRVTIDGAAQNGNIFHHDANTVIDPGMLKEIEVIKGAASASAGPGAIAGKMAMETIGANDFLRKGQNYGGSASASFYTNFGMRFNTIAAYRAEKWDILGYYTHQNIFYYRDGNNLMKNLFNPTYNLEDPFASDKVIGSPSEQNNVLLKFNAYFNDKDSLTISYNMTRYNSTRLLRPNTTSALSKANDPGTQPAPFVISFGKELAHTINSNNNLSFKFNHDGGDTFNQPKITSTAFLSVRNGHYNPVNNPFLPSSQEPTNQDYIANVQDWCQANQSQCTKGTITPLATGGYDITAGGGGTQWIPKYPEYDMAPSSTTANDWTLGNADAEGTLERNIYLINSGVNVKVQHPISADYGNVFEYGAIYQNLSVFSGLPRGSNGLYSGNVNPNDPTGPGLPYRHYYVDPGTEYQQNMSSPNAIYRGLPQNSYAIGNIIGGYMQANYNFLKNLIVGAGTRYDIYLLKDKNGQNHLTSGFSPSATILYNPIDPLGLKVSYAYVTKGALPGDGVLMRDPSVIYQKNLKPTIGQNAEFNIDYNSPYFNVRGAAFYQVINNFVNSYGQDTSKNGGGNATAKNLTGNLPQTITIFGYELSGNVRYKGFVGTFSFARSWPTVASPYGKRGSYDLLADTYALAATYGNVVILKADYTFQRAGLTLTWLSRFVTNMYYNGYSIYYPGYGTMKIHKPGYGVSSIFVNWSPPHGRMKGLLLSAVFNNIFNKQYVNQTSVWQASADAPHDDMIATAGHIRMALPEPGFNARFEISYQF